MLDTNMIVAARRSTRGASAAVVRAVREGQGTFLLTASLLLEYEAKCTEDEPLDAFKLTAGQVDAVLDVLVARAERVEVEHPLAP